MTTLLPRDQVLVSRVNTGYDDDGAKLIINTFAEHLHVARWAKMFERERASTEMSDGEARKKPTGRA